MARRQVLMPICALLFTTSLVGGATKAWDTDSFPNPKRDVNLCGRRGRQSNICDPDSILSFSAANRVEGIIKDIWDGVDPYVNDPCGSEGIEGYQVAVALMRRMHVHPDEDATAAAYRIAKALHAKWGVGSAACDNGVVLLLSVDDRQIYVSTGVGAQKALPDNSLGGIISRMKAPLRAGEYDTALEQAVVDIGLGLAGRPPAGREWGWLPVILFAVVAMFFLYSCWTSFMQNRKYRECQAALRHVREEQHKLRTREWSKPRTCPVCLEEFTTNPEECSTPLAPGTEIGTEEEEASPSAPLLPEVANSSSSKGEGGEPSTSSGDVGISSSILRRRGSGRMEDAEAGRKNQRRGGGDGGGGGRKGVDRVPVTLRCGHTFCEPCLGKWLERATTCPICRERVDGGEGPESGIAGTDSSSGMAGRGGGGQRARGLTDDVLTAELAFRLMTLQHRYPAYITPSLVDQWSGEAQQTGTFDFEAAREFQLNDPAVRAQHESMGRSGNSISFGGGSGGGGGAGGRW